jgi:hypothetical protein
MGDLISFETFKRDQDRCGVLALFKDDGAAGHDSLAQANAFSFPTSRPGISGNLSDLFEQANAVVMRHYEGDRRVPDIVAAKCIELLKVLGEYAEPE